MAQVTMDGREYVELVNNTKKVEAENKLLLETLILGKLVVDPQAGYREVVYDAKAELPMMEDMAKFVKMRIADVTKKLEQNPLAVQLLYTEGNNYLNPHTGNFTSYGWDENVAVQELSEVLGEMYEHLENGELLVVVENEEEK